MTTKIQFRRDTATNWATANTVLSQGEIGYETDTTKTKIGDGTTAWTDLGYSTKTMAASSEVVGTADSQTLTNKTLTSPIITSPTISGSSTIVNNAVIATSNSIVTGLSFSNSYGTGFMNMEVYTSGSSATWTVPTTLRYTGAKWKVTLVGGGGAGGSTAATAGQIGAGGGSGALTIGYYTYSTGVDSMTYNVGAAGTPSAGAVGGAGGASNTTYNATLFSAGGGGGGNTAALATVATPGGTASGGTLNINGGNGDAGGTTAATATKACGGGNTPLGYGAGGRSSSTVTTSANGTGYGAGGSGGYNGATAAATTGAYGTSGLLIIEY